MKKILVVDDEELLIRTMNRMLEKKGYEVYSVKNGADAIASMEDETFDLVITDIRMPGKNGVEMVREIQTALEANKKKLIPVIFVTGYADEAIEKEAKKLNPVAYIMKPFDVKDILNAIHRGLGV